MLSAIGILLASVGCTTEPHPTPEGAPFHLVRHAPSSTSPLGLGTGVVDLRGDCLYLGRLLLVWPAEFEVGVREGEAVIQGAGVAIAIGDTIEVGGGEYPSQAALPSPILGNSSPCPGPYLWVGEVVRVVSTGSA